MRSGHGQFAPACPLSHIQTSSKQKPRRIGQGFLRAKSGLGLRAISEANPGKVLIRRILPVAGSLLSADRRGERRAPLLFITANLTAQCPLLLGWSGRAPTRSAISWPEVARQAEFPAFAGRTVRLGASGDVVLYFLSSALQDCIKVFAGGQPARCLTLSADDVGRRNANELHTDKG